MISFPFNISELMLRLGNLLRGRDDDEFVSPLPQAQAQAQEPQPTPQPQINYEDVIREGLTEWGKGTAPPIASASAQLAELGGELPHRYLPAALSLKETGGLTTAGQEEANPFGIGPGIKYPDPQTAIMGGGNMGADGGPQKGLKGVILNSGIYDDYLESGNLKDFFSHYTPDNVHNNPGYDEQIQLINDLMAVFERVEESKKKGGAKK